MNTDYGKHQVSQADKTMLSKIVALYDRVNDPNFEMASRGGTSSLEMTEANKEAISGAIITFMQSCCEIAKIERMEYRAGQEIDKEAQEKRREQYKADMESTTKEGQWDMKQRITEEYQRECEQIAELAKPKLVADHTSDLREMSALAITSFTQTLRDTHALDGMVLGVEGSTKEFADDVANQYAKDNQLSGEQFEKHAYTGQTALFGRDITPIIGESPYDIVIGFTKALNTENMDKLAASINAKKGSAALDMLFKREADQGFVNAGKDLQQKASEQVSL